MRPPRAAARGAHIPVGPSTPPHQLSFECWNNTQKYLTSLLDIRNQVQGRSSTRRRGRPVNTSIATASASMAQRVADIGCATRRSSQSPARRVSPSSASLVSPAWCSKKACALCSLGENFSRIIRHGMLLLHGWSRLACEQAHRTGLPCPPQAGKHPLRSDGRQAGPQPADPQTEAQSESESLARA